MHYLILLSLFIFSGNSSAQTSPPSISHTPSSPILGQSNTPTDTSTIQQLPDSLKAQIEQKLSSQTTDTPDDKDATLDLPKNTVPSISKNLSSSPSIIESVLSSGPVQGIEETITQYGYDIFNRSTTSFTPLTTIPVGPEYIVGPKDSFTIQIWGKINQEFTVDVDNSGSIYIPQLGSLSIWGLTVAKLEKKLEYEFSKFFTNFELALSFKKIRSITIYSVGEVNSPGSYEVSSLATLFSSLFITGGPKKSGSLRNIQLIRDNKTIATFDLYNFLFYGDKSNDQKLQSGDTIYIPHIGPVVGIRGHIHQSGIYEFTGGKITLGDVINYAKGLTVYGHLARIQVERVENHKRRVVRDFHFNENLFEKGIKKGGTLAKTHPAFNYILKDKDLVTVFPIINGLDQVVYLEGHVNRPGKYAFTKGMQLKSIIASIYDLLPEPYLEYAFIRRITLPDRDYKIIPINLDNELNKKQSITLNNLDRIRIFSKKEIQQNPTVLISGEVKRGGAFSLDDGMRVKDIIFQAGGLNLDAYMEQATIVRKSEVDFKEELLSINLTKALNDNKNHNLKLQNLDSIKIYSINEFKDNQFVTISGSVRKPGTKPFLQNMTIQDLIFQSGGLKQDAFLEHAELTRLTYSMIGTKTEVIPINLISLREKKENSNIELQPNDHLSIRRIPDWYYSQIIDVSGEVVFPGSYSFKSGDSLYSILQRAGGFTQHAYPYGAIFQRESVKTVQRQRLNQLINEQEQALLQFSTYASEQTFGSQGQQHAQSIQQNVSIRQQLLEKLRSAELSGRIIIHIKDIESFKGSTYDIPLENSDKLLIPARQTTVNVLGSVYNPNSVIHNPKWKIKHYLSEVGGPTPDADDNNIFLIKADGSVISKENYDGFFTSFNSLKLNPGDSILVPRDLKPRMNVLGFTKDITEILFQLATTTGIIWAIGR